MIHQQIQHHITGLYDLLSDNDDFRELTYWFSDNIIGQNEVFLHNNYQLNIKRSAIRQELNKLSETAEDIWGLVNSCKNLVIMECGKRKSAKKKYEQYHNRKKVVKI